VSKETCVSQSGFGESLRDTLDCSNASRSVDGIFGRDSAPTIARVIEREALAGKPSFARVIERERRLGKPSFGPVNHARALAGGPCRSRAPGARSR